MFKIQTFNKISEKGLGIFKQKGYTVSDKLSDYDAIIVRSQDLHNTEFPESLLAIARAGAGVNNIPVQKCAEKGIVVFNTPGANANAVKELAILGLLLASRKVVEGIEWTKSLLGKNENVEDAVEKNKSKFEGPEIMGKTLGVIGLGAIGVLVANAAVELGMDVIGYDPYISVEAAWALSRQVKRALTLDEVYKNSDYISLHVPATDSTKGMINKKTVALMKDGVRILNFSRAAIVKEEELVEALEAGKVACYVTDFPNEKVLGKKNVVPIPHLGASTPEAEENCAIMAANQIIEYLETGNIKNSVNYPDVFMAFNESEERICILHKNVPDMVRQFSKILSDNSINIEDLINKSKGEFAYTLIDVKKGSLNKNIENQFDQIKEVIKLRFIK
ncbi:MAG TPA: 3-phosphoglycerate dehydrogenase family protein [Spirochaetota bacterium]|nr:3-phosphoglycerate dehydrogenase family protein [Spirochaetota bacterium]HPQ49017.1 3-phosphoglycerate dehydrogenase family protein [Spirochaetota bacterium]